MKGNKKQTDIQAGRRADSQMCKKAGSWTDMVGRLKGKQNNWHMDRQTDRRVNRETD